MTTKVKIIKGEHKGKTGRVVGVYPTRGELDVKIGRKYFEIKSTYCQYQD